MNMQTAEAVSATINTNRNCTVEITNISSAYCLINPKVCMTSGFSFHPPQPTIRTAKTENHMCTERMAILFSVPYDYHLYKNVLGIGIFESSRECNKALYKHMYEGKDFSQFTRVDAGGSGVLHRGKKVDLRVTMSTVGKAILKLEVYDKMG